MASNYRLFGQKIFITWGDHDLTPNTIHMVLGRIDGAPAGVKGISLFIVPKYLVNPDGSLGARNDVRCLSIEHKLGIHASPTCVLAFGEKDGAVAYRVGEAGRGLEYMFIMMNSARLSVGSEGYAVGERAFQRALEWARTRVQGKPPVAQPQGPGPDHRAPGRQAHAAADEVPDRGLAGAGTVCGLAARSCPRRYRRDGRAALRVRAASC